MQQLSYSLPMTKVATLDDVEPSLLVTLQTYTPLSDNCTSNIISVVV